MMGQTSAAPAQRSFVCLVRFVIQTILERNADAVGAKRTGANAGRPAHDENPNLVEVQRIETMRIENYQRRARFNRKTRTEQD
jgi:hypothetical protein